MSTNYASVYLCNRKVVGYNKEITPLSTLLARFSCETIHSSASFQDIEKIYCALVDYVSCFGLIQGHIVVPYNIYSY